MIASSPADVASGLAGGGVAVVVASGRATSRGVATGRTGAHAATSAAITSHTVTRMNFFSPISLPSRIAPVLALGSIRRYTNDKSSASEEFASRPLFVVY